MSRSLELLDPLQLNLTIKRLCFQLTEQYKDFSDAVIIGLQPRGIYLANRICDELKNEFGIKDLKHGDLDVTFYRDDLRIKENPPVPSATEINFIVEDKTVILVDDVLFTGRTIRAGLDALLAFGRPKKVELLVLIERRFSRDLPIEANYIGKSVDSINSQKVKVSWKETEGIDRVTINS